MYGKCSTIVPEQSMDLFLEILLNKPPEHSWNCSEAVLKCSITIQGHA